MKNFVIAALKRGGLRVNALFGSGQLVGSPLAANLIDDYLLMIHPLVLGSGRRLFPRGRNPRLRLIDAVTSTTGVVIAVYESERRRLADPGLGDRSA